MTAPTYGGTFCGVGGLDLGFDRAGFIPQWQVEIDKACGRVLADRWPDIPHYTDIKEVHGDQLAPVDLLCGGFPCQDVSKAGKRAGLAGARSGLFFDFMRVAEGLGFPDWLVIENVPGLLSSNDGGDMGTIVGALADVGYGWSYRVLDARFFGAPQRRRRLFIVGRAGDQRAAAEVLLGPDSGAGNPDPDERSGWATGRETGVGPAGRLIFRKSRRAQSVANFETWVPDDFCNCLNRFDTGQVRSTTLVVEPDQGVRILTPEEWEAAQGLDRGWTAPGADTARCRRVGNAVNVQVSEWLARRIFNQIINPTPKETE